MAEMEQTPTPPIRQFVYGDIPLYNAFRYLVLHAGANDDPLECSLLTTYLDAAPSYAAISYVWGSDTLDHHITCNGRALYITRNLSKALFRLRSPDNVVTLWADSVCINQTDLEEKGHQVATMSEIYRNASTVLIYMGEDPDRHGLQVKSLLEDVVTLIDDEITKLEPGPCNTLPSYYRETPFLSDTRWDSLHALLGQTWFARGWVVREAALAQNGVIVWGHNTFSWTSLMRVLLWLHTRAHDITNRYENLFEPAIPHLDAYVDRNNEALRYLPDVSTWHPNSLLDYLAAGRKLNMKDPRDRLYAFIDIATGMDREIVVEPRYGDSTIQVYRDFAVQHVKTTLQTRILDYVIHSTASLEADIPTWVPSWDYQENGPWRGEEFRALTPRENRIQPPLITDNLLKVHAVVLGSVRYVSSTLKGPTLTAPTLQNIWSEIHPQLQPHFSTFDPLRMFVSSFSRFGHYQALVDLISSYAKNSQLTNDLPSKDPTDVVGESSCIDRWTRIFANAKRFMLLDRGYMGLGPAVTEEGDMFCIIFGCTTPCILRKTDKQNRFQFIGQCYIPGSQSMQSTDGFRYHPYLMGSEDSKDWITWDVEEQCISLC